MTEGSGANGAPHPFIDRARALGIDVDDPGALAWMEEYLSEFRQQASGQRPLHWILGIGVVVGLAAHVGGFLLRSSVTTEPLEVVADLLYSLGFALWTGVVVVVFVQIWPEAKRRQLERWLDAYDAALREKGPSRRRPGVGGRRSADGEVATRPNGPRPFSSAVPFRARRQRFTTVNHGHSLPLDLGALYYRCARHEW